MDEEMNVAQAEKCQKCGMMVTDGKCVGCDNAPENCTCTVPSQTAVV